MMHGFKGRTEWELKTCPRCLQKLNWIEFRKRKKLKICKCGKCGRVIDERFLHWQSLQLRGFYERGENMFSKNKQNIMKQRDFRSPGDMMIYMDIKYCRFCGRKLSIKLSFPQTPGKGKIIVNPLGKRKIEKIYYCSRCRREISEHEEREYL